MGMFQFVAVASYNLRQRHFVETDMQADGPGHKKVVMCTLSGAERAVLLFLVVEVFINTSLVALDI